MALFAVNFKYTIGMIPSYMLCVRNLCRRPVTNCSYILSSSKHRISKLAVPLNNLTTELGVKSVQSSISLNHIHCNGSLDNLTRTQYTLPQQYVYSDRANHDCVSTLWEQVASFEVLGSWQQHDDHYHSRWRQSQGGRGAILCLAGFSLKELLGEPEEEEDQAEKEKSELIMMIKNGVIAFYHGEYDKSESLLHLALRYAQEIGHEQGVTYIFDVLANLAYQRGQYNKAEDLFKSVLQRHVADGADPHGNPFVAVSLKLAHCYVAKGEIENAITGYHYCIAVQNEKLHPSERKESPANTEDTEHTEDVVAIPEVTEEDDEQDTLILWAMSVEQYSQLLVKIGRYSIARQHLQEVLQVCLKVKGESHLQTAVLRNDIGSILSMEQRYTEAITEIEQAIEIVKAHIQKEIELNELLAGTEEEEVTELPKKGPIPNLHPVDPWSNLATYLTNLGSIKLLSGKVKEAKQCCDEAEMMAKRSPDVDVQQEAARCLTAVKEALSKAKRRAALA